MTEQALKHRLELLDKNLKEIGFLRLHKGFPDDDTKYWGKGNIEIWLYNDNKFDINIKQYNDIVTSEEYDITKIDGSDFILFFSDLRKFFVLFEKLFLKIKR